MTVAYQTYPVAQIDMPGCIHPRDKTARAQILKRNLNVKLYQLVESFYKLTKRPCILNTSFNLHGFPIIRTLEDAVFVLKNSGLDGLVSENYLITKK